jgi:hypothetical protein
MANVPECLSLRVGLKADLMLARKTTSNSKSPKMFEPQEVAESCCVVAASSPYPSWSVSASSRILGAAHSGGGRARPVLSPLRPASAVAPTEEPSGAPIPPTCMRNWETSMWAQLLSGPFSCDRSEKNKNNPNVCVNVTLAFPPAHRLYQPGISQTLISGRAAILILLRFSFFRVARPLLAPRLEEYGRSEQLGRRRRRSMVSPWSMADGLMLDPSAALLGLPRPLADRRRAPQPPGSTANRRRHRARAVRRDCAAYTHFSHDVSEPYTHAYEDVWGRVQAHHAHTGAWRCKNNLHTRPCRTWRLTWRSKVWLLPF